MWFLDLIVFLLESWLKFYVIVYLSDLHGFASSDSGHLRALLQEREHAQIPRTLQNLPERNGLQHQGKYTQAKSIPYKSKFSWISISVCAEEVNGALIWVWCKY